jgi:hypothetical protein
LERARKNGVIVGVALCLAAPANGATYIEQFTNSPPWTTYPYSWGEPIDPALSLGTTYRIDGEYCVPYAPINTFFTNGNVAFPAGKMTLTVRKGTVPNPFGSDPNDYCGGGPTAYSGAEVASPGGQDYGTGVYNFGTTAIYGPGYYEVRMRPSCQTGEISSFFFDALVQNGRGNAVLTPSPEIDVEFPHASGPTPIMLTIHGAGSLGSVQVFLPDGSDPCSLAHDYGFLYVPASGSTAGQITFVIDGIVQPSASYSGTDIPNSQGAILMNAWTGVPTWGGGPPTHDAVNTYFWVKAAPGLTHIPVWAGSSSPLVGGPHQ